MSVRRIVESPRVTKPYSEEQWRAIDAFGRRDRAAARHRRRARDDRRRADVRRDGRSRRARVEHGGRRPDEAQVRRRPDSSGCARGSRRTACCTTARASGIRASSCRAGRSRCTGAATSKPLWHERRADRGRAQGLRRHGRAGRRVAARCREPARARCRKRARPRTRIPWHFIGQERKLPENLDAATNRLDDPMARARLARVFERGLGKPVGYVLPVQRWNAQAHDARRWVSEPWSTRSGKLFLMPGDSPLGFRLPLPSLPYISPLEYPYVIPSDPFAERGELPEPHPLRQPFLRGEQREAPAASARRRSGPRPASRARTAIAVEPRDGRLCVFMPPVAELEDYLDLRRRDRGHGAELDLPVHSRATSRRATRGSNLIKVTPDPGVIEVNVQPAGSWDEMRAITEGLYDDAHHTRLVTEKFMLDGRHTGTGGGNHVVLGGARAGRQPVPAPARSAAQPRSRTGSIIRRCRISSPGCSSARRARRRGSTRRGTIRCTSSSSRSSKRTRRSQPVPPWLVDRLFRNLLIDVTGNTHRTEICIDKLYSPDGPTGRLGLVEFRAFEMPPHPRMSLAQQLLLLVARRALLAHAVPRRPRALGHAAARQVHAAVPRLARFRRRHRRHEPRGLRARCELVRAALRVSLSASTARVHYGAVEIELRQALEPWHVLGEEGAVGGTVRYVDSSLERLQVTRPRLQRSALCRRVQRRSRAVDEHGHGRRVRRRRALSRVATGVEPATDDPDRRAADVRSLRPLVGARRRRLHVPRRASGRPQLRALPRERLRGGKPAARALLPVRPYARARVRNRGR